MKIKTILFCMLIICLLCACSGGQTSQPVPTAPPTDEPISLPTPEPIPQPTPEPSATPEPTPEPTPSPRPTPELQEVPYIEIVNDPDQPIYSGPGYDYDKVGTVKIATGYTIVEESIDYEGNLWGRLKSGAGWIDLSDSRSFNGIVQLVTASYASGIGPEDCDYAVPDGGDYYNYIEINVKAPVTDVQLLALEFTADGMPSDFGQFHSVSQTLHTLPNLDPAQSYIIALFFPGDLSAYGLRLTDENGIEHEYTITISLRNGELMLSEILSPDRADFNPPPDAEIPPQPTPEFSTQSSHPSGAVPYIEIVNDPNQPIYKGPGYDYEKYGTVKIATGYTIVEEAVDYEGNLWGKLKSGAGWIDLTDSRNFDGVISLVTANYAHGINSPKQAHYYKPDVGEYYSLVDFRVTSPVTDVILYSLDFIGENARDGFGEAYAVREVLHQLSILNPDSSYIVCIDFPGDLSAYGLQLTDSSGVIHKYSVFMSGRNGELIISEHQQ